MVRLIGVWASNLEKGSLAGACYEMIGQRDFTFQDQDSEIFCFGQQCHILKPFLSCLTGFAGRFDFLAHSHLARSKK